MNRSVIVYGVLLAAALVGAYVSWTWEPSTEAAGGVVVDRFPAERLSSIRWETSREGEPSLTLHRWEDDRGHYLWVESGDRAFKASGAADRLLDKLDPLRAERRLPEPSDAQLKRFGLDAPKRRLTIELEDGRQRSLAVGAHTYGRRHIYIRDTDDGTYYVLKSGLIDPFRFPDKQLVERSIVGRKEAELRRVTITDSSGVHHLNRHNVDDPTAAFWSVGTAKKQSKSAGSWVSKLLRARVARYLPDGEPEGAEHRLTATVETTDGESLEIEIAAEERGDKPTAFYAHSPFTRSWVELKHDTAAGLVADVAELAGDR